MFVRRLTTAAVAVAASITLASGSANAETGSASPIEAFNSLVMSGSGQGFITGSNAVTSGTAAILELPGVMCSLATMSGGAPGNVFCTPLKYL